MRRGLGATAIASAAAAASISARSMRESIIAPPTENSSTGFVDEADRCLLEEHRLEHQGSGHGLLRRARRLGLLEDAERDLARRGGGGALTFAQVSIMMART